MNYRSGVFVCLLVMVVPCMSATAGELAQRSADWPQWRGPQRTGLSSETGLIRDWNKTPPKLLWMAEGMGRGFASISVAGGTIFTTGNVSDSQAVIAVDVAEGKVLWTSKITSSVPKHSYAGSRSTPTIDGDRLYVVTSNGEIACLKSSDGRLVWKKNFQQQWNGRMMSGWGYSESPLIDGGKVVCTPGGKDAMLVALDKMTGEEIWRGGIPSLGDNGRDGAAYSSIVISQGAGVRQYVQLTGRGVIGIRAADGKFLWGYNQIANGTANVATPVVKDDYVFCATGYNTGAALLKLSAMDGGVEAEEVYFLPHKTLQNHHGGMVLVGDHVFCGTGHSNGFPICVQFKTGQVVWGGKQRGPGSGSAAVTYADGHLVFRYQNGLVALIQATPKSYQLKGTLKPAHVEGPSWSHPVIVGGRLYLREQDKLMCYNVKRE